jgi:hypothetical protein
VRICALDPGLTTGAVIIDWDGTTVPPGPDALVSYSEVPFDSMPRWLQLQILAIDLLVIERYVISPRTTKNSRQYEALYVIGGAIFLARLLGDIDGGVPIRMQASSDAKRAYPDEALEGWDIKGGHAKDALRHALLATHGHYG